MPTFLFSANKKLTKILREHWKFNGYITSDSGAIGDISGAHHYAANATAGTAVALEAGCDINSGRQYGAQVCRFVDREISCTEISCIKYQMKQYYRKNITK